MDQARSTGRHNGATGQESLITTSRKASFAPIALLACVGLFCLGGKASAQAGALDTTFGTGGVFSLGPTVSKGGLMFSPTVTSVALQGDGKILAAGMIDNFPAVLRLNMNGTIDTAFGSSGIATSTFGNQASGDTAVAVAVQSNGQILLAATDALSDNGGLGFELARFDTDGTPDTTFASDGFVNTFPFGQFAFLNSAIGPNAMVIQPDGKIVLAGTGLMVRYETNGQLDPAFGTGGAAALISPSVTAMALQSGKILIASGGLPFVQAFTNTGSIARYNSNGSLDTTFGSSGQASSLVSGTAILLQSTGKIVLAGSLVSHIEIPPAINQTGFALTRLNAGGTVDTTFGVHGAVVTGFASVHPNAVVTALGQQASGDIVAAGVAGSAVPGTTAGGLAGLARYTSVGQLDTTFGSGGTVATGLGSKNSSVVAAVIQSDGNIVVVGGGATTGFIVARFLGQ